MSRAFSSVTRDPALFGSNGSDALSAIIFIRYLSHQSQVNQRFHFDALQLSDRGATLPQELSLSADSAFQLHTEDAPPPPRPKSFKELVAMQKRQVEKNKSFLEMSVTEGQALLEKENASVPAASPPTSGPLLLLHELRESVRRHSRYYSRFSAEMDVFCEEQMRKELPQFRCERLKKEADLSKRLNETQMIMYMTTKQMFFYGHPFRGSAMVSSLAPIIMLSALDEISMGLGVIAIPVYILSYWYFYLTKLVRAVWYDESKDIYTIYLPYRGKPITFKAGQLTEIDDLLANVDIRGTKAFCPQSLFSSPEDYDKMFKFERRRRKNLHFEDFV